MDTQSVLEIVLKAKDDASKTIENAGKTLDNAKKNVENLSKSLKIAGGILTGFGVAGALAMNDWIKSAGDAQVEMARVDESLRKTAESVKNKKMSFEALRGETDKLSKAFIQLGFDDEETSIVFSKFIASTKNVAEAQKLASVSADLARYSGEGLADSAQKIQLAMMGNTRALKAMGIEVAKGATANDILALIQKRVAGQAEAYSKTYKGAMDRMTVSTTNLKEALGDRLLPIATKVIDKITGLVQKVNDLKPETIDLAVKIMALTTGFSAVVGPILLLIGSLPALKEGFAVLFGPLGLILGVATLVAAAAYLIYTNWSQIQPMLQPLFDWLQGTFINIKTEMDGFVNQNLPLFQEAWKNFAQVMSWVLTFIQNIWNSVWPSLLQVFTGVWNAIKGVFQVVWGAIQILMAVGLGVISGDWTKALNMMKQGWEDVWNGILGFLTGIANAIAGVIEGIINAAIGALNTLIDNTNKVTGSKIGRLATIDIPTIGAKKFDYSKDFSTPGSVTPMDAQNARSFYYGDAFSTPAAATSSVNNNQYVSIYANVSNQTDWNQVGSQLNFSLNNNR
jgi:hypothetical protein